MKTKTQHHIHHHRTVLDRHTPQESMLWRASAFALLATLVIFMLQKEVAFLSSIPLQWRVTDERKTTLVMNEPTSSACTINNDTTPDHVCQCLAHWISDAHGGSSGLFASDIWRIYEPKIRQAALESTRTCWWPEMFDKLDLNVFDSFTWNLYETLDMYRMKRSLKSPANPVVTRQVLEIILQRIIDPATFPPLKIAVFGGSVTQGCYAHRNMYGLDYGGMRCEINCTWTAKLERLLNDVLGNDVVMVKNYAIAGADSDIGSTLLEYNLWPGEDKGEEFDIIISAFSSNDGQPPLETVDFLYESWQHFIRLAMDQRPCSDLPLVIQLEDNLLDTLRDNVVHSNLRYSRDMAQTAAWAGIMSVSYADAIRDFVYSNASSQLVTEYGELHPGQGFHTGVAWVMAWNLLNALIDSCDANSLTQNGENRHYRPLPILTTKLRSSEIESMWNESVREHSRLCSNGGKTTAVSCVYKWVAAKLATSTKEAIEEDMRPVLRSNSGWKADGFPVRKPRRTWLGVGLNSSFTIQLDNLDAPVDRMLVLYLKSYGAEWASSRLLLTVEGSNKADEGQEQAWEEIHRAELDGIHDSETSINYSHRITFGNMMKAGSSVRATFTIVGGRRFQINGLALCRSSQPVVEPAAAQS